MLYFSTFSGIGGFELGIQQAYDTYQLRLTNQAQKNKKTRNQKRQCSKRLNICSEGFACVGYSEIDKYAIKVYQRHFPNHQNYGDITHIKTSTLPDFDLLVGGFPCQAFSIAGKRQGFNDSRGEMFFELARLLRAKQPRLFLFENVKGLLSHDTGQTFKVIISTLTKLGYDVQWQVLNSKNFGVPQNRERVFIVGHLRKAGRVQIFPLCQDGHTAPVVPTLTTRSGANGAFVSDRTKKEIKQVVGGSQGKRIYDPRGISVTLSSLGGGLGAKTGLYKIAKTCIRRLTPTECERLQGFPNDWTKGLSDTQRYKTLGNAVTVPVIKAIIERIL